MSLGKVSVRVSDFSFDLPQHLIAQNPPAERDGARMLTLDRDTGAIADRTFLELPSLLHAGDVLVLNNSRVIPSRLYARRAGKRTQQNSPDPSGRIEVLLTEQRNSTDWLALVKPARKVVLGERLIFTKFRETNLSDFQASDPENMPQLSADVIEAGDFGERILRFATTENFFEQIEHLGHVPLPPYLHRPDTAEDRARYQTVYAGENAHGSAAAPTAGLHFTDRVLEEIKSRGVHVHYVTLHVGLGTFQPVRVEKLTDIHLHREHYTLPQETAKAINAARSEGRRIVAGGTTTVRTLEHCAAVANTDTGRSLLGNTHQRELLPHSGETSIFLSPGHRFQLVDALLTNFHLPQSTLLMLVCAFGGTEAVLRAYRHAVEQQYRFFSYGDCMFLS